MNDATYVQPAEGALRPVRGGRFHMEHRDGATLLWDEEWWDDAAPVAVLDGARPPAEAEAWAEGWLAGQAAGREDGRRQGFADCQAGLRALLGAASAGDVTRLLRAAEDAGG